MVVTSTSQSTRMYLEKEEENVDEIKQVVGILKSREAINKLITPSFQ